MKRRYQVNLSLSESDFRVLEALAFLQAKRSKAEVLLPLVAAYLDEHAHDPEVRALLQRRQEALGQLEDPGSP